MKYANLLFTAAWHDPSTRSTLRDTVIPRLERTVAELKSARAEAEAADCRDVWREAGLVADEIRARSALEHARRQLERLA